jgi:hypothetical protein
LSFASLGKMSFYEAILPKGNTLDYKLIEQRIFFPPHAKVAFGGPSFEWNEHMKSIEYPKEWIVVNDGENDSQM